MMFSFGCSMILLWLFSCSSQESKKSSVKVAHKTVSFSKNTQKEIIAPIMKNEGFVEVDSYSDFVLYSFFTQPIQSAVAVDVQSRSFSFLSVSSGVHVLGEKTDTIADLWALHKGVLLKDVDHVVAYGGAKWFSGHALQRASLVSHMGMYFHRLEEDAAKFLSASPYLFAGTIEGNVQKHLEGYDLNLSCSSFGKKQFWCQFPELEMSCVDKTLVWKEELLSLALDQPTEGMYRSIFRSQEIGLCLPSGCYECDTVSCSKTRSAQGLPVKLTPDDWNICLEKNLDGDPERTQLCISKSSLSNKELSLYVDDCTIR